MTLHWWMHWFWITTQIVVSLPRPLPAERNIDNVSPKMITIARTNMSRMSENYFNIMDTKNQKKKEADQLLQNKQKVEAINKKSLKNSSLESIKPIVITDSATVQNIEVMKKSSNYDLLRSISNSADLRDQFEKIEKEHEEFHNKKENKVTWIHTFSKLPKTKFKEKIFSSTTPTFLNLTTKPIKEIQSKALDPGIVSRNQQFLHTVTDVGNYSTDVLRLNEQSMVSHIIVTAASIYNAGLDDPTRLGRARETFAGEYEEGHLSREKHRTLNQKDPISQFTETSTNMTKAFTIIGSCLAIIILLSILAGFCFILYRRKYLNPPQTLNSDKCSNPDSSGYIDDSTIRDNSEEMYSLDNDSFLNSLEAMTIQNYWTDSVKHTKL